MDVWWEDWKEWGKSAGAWDGLADRKRPTTGESTAAPEAAPAPAPDNWPHEIPNILVFAMKLARRTERSMDKLVWEMKVLNALHVQLEEEEAEKEKKGEKRSETLPPFPRLYDYGRLVETEGWRNFVRLRLEGRERRRAQAVAGTPGGLSELKPVPFLVMERVGLSVDELVSAAPLRRLGRRLAASLAVAALEAVQSLHSRGFIHRHLTPRNLALRLPPGARLHFLYTDEDKDQEPPLKLSVVILDLAEAELWPKPPKAARRDFHGSIKYGSPRQHRWEPAGPVDDLWALHYMATEWISGRPLPWHQAKQINGHGGAGPAKLAARPNQLYRLCPPQFAEVHALLQKMGPYQLSPPALSELYNKALAELLLRSSPAWLPFKLGNPTAFHLPAPNPNPNPTVPSVSDRRPKP